MQDFAKSSSYLDKLVRADPAAGLLALKSALVLDGVSLCLLIHARWLFFAAAVGMRLGHSGQHQACWNDQRCCV
jgi:hypothetical protein